MDVTFRPAMHDDIPDLSRLHLLATHGLIDAVYHDAVPGLSTNEINERVLARTGTVRSYENAWVAVHQGSVIGEVHAYPFDDAANSPPNPFIPKDRLVLFEPFDHLAPMAAGAYHIAIVSVYAEFRGKGIGTKLMTLAHSHAEQRGFSKLSLFMFDGIQAVRLYQRLGFVVTGRSPVIKHELLHASGDLLLMTRPVIVT
jgi:ribosomal protein S18 acetylase RimI-like enzyme